MRTARSTGVAVAAILGVTLCFVGRATAQCAMCATSAEAAGDASGGGLTSLFIGALVLLVPALLLIGGAAMLIWKFRDADGSFNGAQSPVGGGFVSDGKTMSKNTQSIASDSFSKAPPTKLKGPFFFHPRDILAGLKNLHTLSLSGTRVTDVGLNHLKGLTGLKKLVLSFSRVSEKGVAELRATLPDCEIQW